MKTLVIYHRVDWDGYTAAAVALRAFPNANLLGWNYGDSLPDTRDYDRVILVDLTISYKGDYAWMHENADKLIWCDHHVAAIKSVNRPDIPGIRCEDDNDNIGAALLTWKTFFPFCEIPEHVKLVATYDIFRKDNKYASFDDAWNYMMFLDHVKMSVNNASRLISDRLMSMRMKIGGICEWFRPFVEVYRFKKHAVEFSYQGVEAYKLYYSGCRPAVLIKEHLKHNCIIFNITGKVGDKYKVSIRVSEHCALNASDIAKQYGGGGHPKAAGCLMSEEQLQNL